MNALRKIIRNIGSPVSIGILVLCVSIIAILFGSKLLYARTVDLFTINLRERILTVSTTAATDISAADLEALQEEGDWQKPEWARIVNKLNKIKYGNKDIVFMYIFRKTSEDSRKMEFVADADSINPYANMSGDPSQYVDVNRDGKIEADGPDKLQWPGQPYPEAVDIPETFAAYEKAITNAELYTDEYGTVLTGYAPIRDEMGNTVAVLATDIKANDFIAITTQTLRPFLFFIIFLTITISILTVLLIYISKRYSRFLEKSNNEKSEFISFASHQIRTPLTSVKGNAANLLEGDLGELSPKAKEVIRKILVRSNDAVSLIGQYLDKSKMDLGQLKYEFTEYDLANQVKLVVNEFQPNAETAQIELNYTIDTTSSYTINADQGKLKEVIGNLLDNSIKYTPQGSVKVTLTRKNNRALIEITDTGVGMTPETIKDLFKKFGRGKDASKTNLLGTGLGLFLAKEFVNVHNGKVWATSPGEGKGSTFFIELPLK